MSVEDRGTGDAELAAEIAVLEDQPQRGRVLQGLTWLRELQRRRAATAPVDIDRAFLRRILSRTKHGPGGRGGNGSCDTDCVKCEAERRFDRPRNKKLDITICQDGPTLILDGRQVDGLRLDGKRYEMQRNLALRELICLDGHWLDQDGFMLTVLSGLTHHCDIRSRAPTPDHAGRQAIPVINPSDAPELPSGSFTLGGVGRGSGGGGLVTASDGQGGEVPEWIARKKELDAMVPGYTAGAGWQSRVHAAADKIDRGANVVDDEKMISKVMATTGIDRAGAEQAIVDGRKLASELIAKCDAAVFLGDSPGVRAARAAITLPVLPMRTPVEVVLARLERFAKRSAANASRQHWVAEKDGNSGICSVISSDAVEPEDMICETITEADADHVVATQPAAILALIATVREMIPLVKDWADRRRSELADVWPEGEHDVSELLGRALLVEVP